MVAIGYVPASESFLRPHGGIAAPPQSLYTFGVFNQQDVDPALTPNAKKVLSPMGGPPSTGLKAPTTKKRRLCTVEGCTTSRKKNGLCQRHGSGVTLCKEDGCKRNAKRGGRCIFHGGGLCKVPGCLSGARKHGMCHTHNRFRLAAQDENGQVSMTALLSEIPQPSPAEQVAVAWGESLGLLPPSSSTAVNLAPSEQQSLLESLSVLSSVMGGLSEDLPSKNLDGTYHTSISIDGLSSNCASPFQVTLRTGGDLKFGSTLSVDPVEDHLLDGLTTTDLTFLLECIVS